MTSLRSTILVSMFLWLTTTAVSLAQMPEAWVQAREGQPCRLLLAPDGDLIVGASMLVPSTVSGAFYDSVVARYSPTGTLRWIWKSNETQDDRLRDIALDAQGNIFAVGTIGTSAWGQAPFATRLMKFSSTGQRLLTATYTPGRAGLSTAPEGVRVAPDGSVTIFGQDYGPNPSTQRDIFIARYTSGGAHQWTFRRGGPVWDFVFDLTFDQDSNTYWVGSTFRPGTDLLGSCLGKLNPAGQQAWIWLQPVANNAGGWLSHVSFDHAGNLIASGHAEYFPGFEDGMLLKATPGGQQQFYTLWDGPDARWDRFFTHTLLSDNSIVTSGDTYAGDGPEYYDVPTIRFSPAGQEQWRDIYGSTLYYPNSTEEWSLNMFTLPGDQVLTISTDWARPGYDYALHRYAANGTLQERVVRELASGDIKDIPDGCAVHDPARNALYLLGWGSGFPANPIADHFALIRIDLPNTTPACPADLDNGSGTGAPDNAVDINDLLYFLVVFEVGGVNADLDNGSGSGTPDGAVTIDDLLYFLVRFEAGC